MKQPLRLTNSRLKTWQRCPRLHAWKYLEGWRERKKSHALRFGSLWHDIREDIWRGREIRELPEDVDPVDRVKLEEMARGYLERWGPPKDVVGVEVFLETPLFHPETGEDHPGGEWLAGKLDSITRVEPGAMKVLVWDGKTSSESLEEGSPLWERLIMDSQISQYFVLCHEAGWEPVGWVHDVVRKPALERLSATPEGSRKYRKPKTKEEKELDPRDPALLYKGQRLEDESLDEYRERLRADIAERPDFYFARRHVERLDHTLLDHLRTLWGTAELMSGPPVMNTSGCVMTGLGRCPMLGPCQSGGHPESFPEDFEQVDDPHPELERTP